MVRAQSITSAANPLLKDVRRAIARGSLTDEGLCLAETFHLLEEALRSHCKVHAVLAAESAQPAVEAQLEHHHGIKLSILPDALFHTIAATQTTQGVMALVQPPEWTPGQLFGPDALVVVLDAVQDPGNAGTIARTAEAFGATGMILLKGTVSPWNPKTLRASAGSLFRLPLLQGLDAEAAGDLLRQNGVALFSGVPAGSHPPARLLMDTILTGRCALAIGSEGHGISAALRAGACDVSIPTVGVESLNAAIAAGIFLYEARRQRMQRA